MRLFNIFSRKRQTEKTKHTEDVKATEAAWKRLLDVAIEKLWSSDRRARAQDAIKQSSPGIESALHMLIDGLRDPSNSERRHLSAFLLAGMGEIAIPYVTPLLEDENTEVRRLAVRILARIEQTQKEITG